MPTENQTTNNKKITAMKKINTTTAARKSAKRITTAVKNENNSPRGLVRTLIALCEGITPAAAAKAVATTADALAAADKELRAARKAVQAAKEGTSEHAAAVMAVQAAETARAAAAKAANDAAEKHTAHIICAALDITSKSNKDARAAAAKRIIDMLPVFTVDEAGAVKPAKLTAVKDMPGTYRASGCQWVDAVGDIAAALELHNVVRNNVARIAAVRAEQRKITAAKLAAVDEAKRPRVAKQRDETEKIKLDKAKAAARADIAAARQCPAAGRNEVVAGVYYTVDVHGGLTPCEAVDEVATA